MNISVIGAGTMGNGIAHVFAQSGHNVSLIDISQPALDKALTVISNNLDRQIAKGSMDELTKTNTLENISTFTDISNGVKSADVVVEAATENQELKLKIFSQMDEHAPDHAILASNTSSISITKIAAATKRPRK
jgi:3-hydroxybutyryl-CoA dehydrogenase